VLILSENGVDQGDIIPVTEAQSSDPHYKEIQFHFKHQSKTPSNAALKIHMNTYMTQTVQITSYKIEE
jgi:hypothetical protein